MVHPEDRDYLLFLWVDNIESSEPTIKEYRFGRVVFGVALSPFLLNATVRHHLTNSNLDERFVHDVLRSLYVDDYVSVGIRVVVTSLPSNPEVPISARATSIPAKVHSAFHPFGVGKMSMDCLEAAARGAYICFRSARRE